MNKFYYLLVLIVVLAIALISRWLLSTVETPTGRVSPEARHDPDYFLQNFKVTVFQPNGAPAYYLKAEYMNHYPDDDTMDLKMLRIDYLDANKQTWITTANKGTAYKNIEVMQLAGNVHIFRQTQEPDKAITVTTESLRIDFPNKHASTEAKVKIVGKNSTIDARGMDVDMATGHFSLLSNARGHYVPQ